MRLPMKHRIMVAVSATLAALTFGLAASPPAGAVNFNLCSNWTGWRYGGDGFDYASQTWGWLDGHLYHSYWQRSVLNGTVSSWRIRCS